MARVVGVYGDQVTHRKIGLGVWMDVLDEACKLVADGDLRRGVRGFTAANVKVGAYIYVAPVLLTTDWNLTEPGETQQLTTQSGSSNADKDLTWLNSRHLFLNKLDGTLGLPACNSLCLCSDHGCN